MRTHSFGAETVLIALAGDLLVGTVHNGKNYKIMLARINGEEIVETRFLAGKNDWEGQAFEPSFQERTVAKIKIVRGIPPEKQNDVASLVYSADPDVFKSVLGRKAVLIITHSLNDKMMFVATTENKIVGVLGMASRCHKSINIKLPVLLKINEVKFLKSFLLWQFIKSTPREDELFIEFIAVKPQYRGMGIGTSLLKEAIDFAHRCGSTRVRLFVRGKNTDAKRLYENLGFVVEKTIQVPFPLNRLLSIEKGYKMVLIMGGGENVPDNPERRKGLSWDTPP